MFGKLNGMDIVATISGDQPYWRLGAADVQRWVASLPPSATQDNVSRVEWVGEAWDGSSDVIIGERSWGREMKAAGIVSLLRKLRSAIGTLGNELIVPPEISNVRICRIASNSVLVVDFDLVDFILPIAIDGSRAIGKRGFSISAIAAQMVEFVKGADAIRPAIVDREAGMRRALEETTAEIGHAAAPLWMRLGHVSYYDDPKHLPDMGYVVLLTTINENLVWAPTGSERIHTVQEVRDHRDYGTKRWLALCRFLDDGRLEIDNNIAERALRGVAVGRRNWLFAGSKTGGERAAAIYTVIQTCKANGVDPQAYIADVTGKIAADWPAARWDELMPWNWSAQTAERVAQAA